MLSTRKIRGTFAACALAALMTACASASPAATSAPPVQASAQPATQVPPTLTAAPPTQQPATATTQPRTATPVSSGTAAGFSFGVQGDSHPERAGKMFSADLYRLNLQNVAKANPAFYVMMGDDFTEVCV